VAALTLPDPPLSDGVITLRGFESSDVPTIVAICQDPEIPRWTLVPSPYGEQEGRDHLTRVADGLAAATRTVHLLAQWAFETLGLERLELHIDKHNARSLAVAARSGFTQVAEPVLQRAETAHFPADVFFARMRGG